MQMQTIKLIITSIETQTQLIKSFTLQSVKGEMLPGWEPGAHIQVEIPPSAHTQAQWRSYSLCNIDPTVNTSIGVRSYQLGIRREDSGNSGSLYMHSLSVGSIITVRPPTNHFPLADQSPVILFAGGIGITPIMSMATKLIAQNRPFTLHYSGRTYDSLAFIEKLRNSIGERLVLHADDDSATCLKIDSILKASQVNQPIYVCGPSGMINAVFSCAKNLGWHECDLHSELFTEPQTQHGDNFFEIEIKSTGQVLTVPPDKSVLDVLIDGGYSVLYDCKGGYCGLCSTQVVSGQIDHRDTYLSDSEHAGGKVMQVCVSRCKSQRLVLDL